jgi:hypothetical protein
MCSHARLSNERKIARVHGSSRHSFVSPAIYRKLVLVVHGRLAINLSLEQSFGLAEDVRPDQWVYEQAMESDEGPSLAYLGSDASSHRSGFKRFWNRASNHWVQDRARCRLWYMGVGNPLVFMSEMAIPCILCPPSLFSIRLPPFQL